MWSHRIIVPSPAFDEHLRLFECVENLPIEQLVPQLAIERFNVTILPRAARFNIQRSHVQLAQPFAHILRRELRTVIGPQVVRRTALSEQLRQPIQHVLLNQPLQLTRMSESIADNAMGRPLAVSL